MYESFLSGLQLATSFNAILYILLGVVLGIIFGATPGISTTMGIALTLPMTYAMSLENGLALLLGVFVGGVSGGLITAILINVPGTPASIATTFDGYPMAKNGEAGKALGVGLLFSFYGGIFSWVVLIFLSPVLARFALKLGPTEYFAIALFSLTLIASLSGKSLLKGLISGGLGLMLATVGVSPIDGFTRFSFGSRNLRSGFDLVTVLIGIYAVAEVFNIAKNPREEKLTVISYKMKGFGIGIKEFFQQQKNALVSAFIGTGIGILPGLGAGIANLVSYSTVKSLSKTPDKFGTGIIDGVVASETANNATTGGALVPLLTLGIPGDGGTALMMAAFFIHGITPGPLLFKNHGPTIYAIFVMLLIANVAMIIIEYFGMRFFINVLKVPKYILFPIIIVLCTVGAFGSNNRVFDVYAVLFFGVVGFLLSNYKYPLPPVILGFILGDLIETNLRRGLMSTYDSFWPFLTRPISGLFLFLTLSFMGYIVFKAVKNKRKIFD